MIIQFAVPRWRWTERLFDRLFPGTARRAKEFGYAKSSRSFLGGVVEFNVEVGTTERG